MPADPSPQDDPQAEVTADGYMYGELAVARAIGSAAWKRDPSRRALIPTPDLVSIQLQPDDDFVVLATDGLWDKVDNTQVRAPEGWGCAAYRHDLGSCSARGLQVAGCCFKAQAAA